MRVGLGVVEFTTNLHLQTYFARKRETFQSPSSFQRLPQPRSIFRNGSMAYQLAVSPFPLGMNCTPLRDLKFSLKRTYELTKSMFSITVIVNQNDLFQECRR